MTIPQPFRKFAGLAVCAALSSATSACSSKDDVSPGAGGAGGDSTGAGSDEVVGTFQVQVQVDETDATTGMTKIVGQVGDGPVPANVVWTVVKEDGSCRLETPAAPFCEAGCGSSVCVADDQCQAYPVGHSVGGVTLEGVKLATGGTALTLKEIAKTYQPPAGTALSYPPFGFGDDVSLHATGGDYAAFDLATKGVDPLSFTSSDFEIEEGKELALTWAAPEDPKSAQIHVKVDISHHGGIKGMIECDSDDTGGVTISAALMTELIGLGVAGFPSVVVMRQSIDSVKLAPGRVNLEVSARVEQYLKVKGVDSCTVDTDCPPGKTCRTMDSTCQ